MHNVTTRELEQPDTLDFEVASQELPARELRQFARLEGMLLTLIKSLELLERSSLTNCTSQAGIGARKGWTNTRVFTNRSGSGRLPSRSAIRLECTGPTH